MSEPTAKYNLKLKWGTRRAINRAVARKAWALCSSDAVLLQTMPSMSHVLNEIIAEKLNFEMPKLDIDANPGERVNLMFQAPWRIKKAFLELCAEKGMSQNAVINEMLAKHSLEEIENMVTVDEEIGWEPGQGFTCTLDSPLKRKILKRCAQKMLDCEGRRQWGAGDVINMVLAAATGLPVSATFFEEPDRGDDEVISLILILPLPVYQEIQRRSDESGRSIAKLINSWVTEFIDTHKP